MRRTLKRKILKSSKKQRPKKGANKRRCTKRHRLIRGGSASFQPFENQSEQYYYKLNDHTNDPNDPSVVTSSRNLSNMTGGKKKQRKMRGGEPIFSSVFGSFGNATGANIGKTVFSGQQLTNDSAINQPAFSRYNAHSSPLA